MKHDGNGVTPGAKKRRAVCYHFAEAPLLCRCRAERDISNRCHEILLLQEDGDQLSFSSIDCKEREL